MIVTFLSNFYNHHQAPFSEIMAEKLNGGYAFIATEKMSSERLSMGWGNEPTPNFVHNYEEEKEWCDDRINKSDVVIIGSAPYELIKNRLKNGQLTFLYSERIFRKEPSFLKLLKYKFTHHRMFGRFKSIYLLCASAFAYRDYVRMMSFRDKAFKWGYFPRTYTYEDFDQIIKNKEKPAVSLLYVSRMIELKHPELPVFVAERLKEEGIHFTLTMVGNGVIKNDILKMVREKRLEKEIVFIDCLRPEEVRKQMLLSDIFLFTSHRNGGWGAVLNEAMNSCCAVVASSAIGSVPFLLKNGENGFVFKDGCFEDLYKKTKELCIDKELRQKMSLNAYKTIVDMWCAEKAAERLIQLCDDISKGIPTSRFNDGVCSKAEDLADNWFGRGK